MLELRLALAQSNMSGLEEELYAVSYPTSERYGLHLSQSQVGLYLSAYNISLLSRDPGERFLRRTKETVDVVIAWLDSNRIARRRFRQPEIGLRFPSPFRRPMNCWTQTSPCSRVPNAEDGH